MSILWIVLAGLFLAVLHLVVGISIGLLVRRQSHSASPWPLDAQRASELTVSLEKLTHSLHENVENHQLRLHEVRERLSSVGEDESAPLTDLVVGVVGELLQANESLQTRLVTAEGQLNRQRQEIESHLSRSLTDELTQLPNRRAFDGQLLERIDAFRNHQVPCSLILLDLDHFKKINDEHGHLAGDAVLQEVAKALRAALRRPDLVARYGGEEFAILLMCTSLADAEVAAYKAMAAIRECRPHYESAKIAVTASLGISEIEPGDDAHSLIQRADEALYASKHDGRNCGHLSDGSQILRIGGEDAAAEAIAPSHTDRNDLLENAPQELLSACEDLKSQLTAALPADREDSPATTST